MGGLVSFEKLVRVYPDLVGYERMEAYYEGKHRLDALGVSLPPNVRVLEMVVDWPRVVVEALVERLHVDGFTVDADEAPTEFLRWWRANGMPANSTLLHAEVLTQGIGYVIVGETPVDDQPQWTVATRLGIAAHVNEVSGEVVEAVRRFQIGKENWAVHLEAGRTTYYARTRYRTWVKASPAAGMPASVRTPFSRPPIVPVVNRGRILARQGRSEMQDVIGYTDACSRSLTGLQIGQELLAMPIRYLLGGKGEAMKGPDGRLKTQWEVYLSHLLTGPADAKVGQLDGADLSQIHATVRLYAGLVAGSTGLPLSSLGVGTEANPASAEAVNAYSARHVKKAELKQTVIGDAYEKVLRLGAELVEDRELIEAASEVETRWRNAATITTMEVAQSATMLVGAGIIPPEVAWDMLDLTAAQRRLAEQWVRSDVLRQQGAFGG